MIIKFVKKTKFVVFRILKGIRSGHQAMENLCNCANIKMMCQLLLANASY